MLKGKELVKHFLAIIFYASSIGLVFMACAEANHNDGADCLTMQNENSRKICQDLARVEMKVDRLLQLLETGHQGNGQYGQVYIQGYTCKINFGTNSRFEGYGNSVEDARQDAVKFCNSVGYSISSCNQNFANCDVDRLSQSGHYKCEVQFGQKIFQGLGINKVDARSMAFELCIQTGYSKTSCLSNFKRCYEVTNN